MPEAHSLLEAPRLSFWNLVQKLLTQAVKDEVLPTSFEREGSPILGFKLVNFAMENACMPIAVGSNQSSITAAPFHP